MKKCLFVLSFILLVSCTTTKEEIKISCAPDLSNYSISVRDAIDNLNQELHMIDVMGTRVCARTIKSVKSINLHNTRVEDTQVNNDLLYIVEFDDNKGSAVISADKRIKSVIAILDNTVITENNFQSDDMTDIGNYMASLITDYVECQIQESKVLTRATYKPPKIDTIYNRSQKPLTKTKWDQSYPYNKLCKSNSGESVPAGCVAIAAAQLLEFHKYPANITINKQTFDWTLLEQCEYGKSVSINAQDEVANFVYNIGRYLGINYAGNQSGAETKKVVNLLKSVGYSSAQYVSYNLETVRKYVYVNKSPIIIRGIHKGADSGHAWILDGLREYSVRSIQYLADGGTMDRTITSNKIHCNFGWAGYCDGYYDSEVFDTTRQLNSVYIDSSVGDKPQGNVDAEYNYNSGLRLVTYSLK